MGERIGVYRVLMGKPEGKRSLGRGGVDGRVILIWIFRKYDVGYGLDRAALNRDRWPALVTAVMNLRVP